jgi:RNA polymerase sigma factor (sigma-70 family)
VSAVDQTELVAEAVAGDKDALDQVVRLLIDPLYRLALRMVGRQADAEDAVQEILIRVITRLGSFRGEAALTTWAYRIGVNYLLNLRRRSPWEAGGISFEQFADGLIDGLADTEYIGPEAQLLAREVRLACTQAMLQCLDRDDRVVFVLAEVFELSSADAAWVLDVTSAAYRKRLERARAKLRIFMSGACGLVNPTAACRCAKRVDRARGLGRVDPARPGLARHPTTLSGHSIVEAEEQMHRLHDAAAVLRAHPDYAAPGDRVDAVLALLDSGRFPLLE